MLFFLILPLNTNIQPRIINKNSLLNSVWKITNYKTWHISPRTKWRASTRYFICIFTISNKVNCNTLFGLQFFTNKFNSRGILLEGMQFICKRVIFFLIRINIFCLKLVNKIYKSGPAKTNLYYKSKHKQRKVQYRRTFIRARSYCCKLFISKIIGFRHSSKVSK